MATDEAVPHKKRVLRIKRAAATAKVAAPVSAPVPASTPPETPRAEPPAAEAVRVDPIPAAQAAPALPPSPEPEAAAPMTPEPAPAPVAEPAATEPPGAPLARASKDPVEETREPGTVSAALPPTPPEAPRVAAKRGIIHRIGHAVGALATFLIIVIGVTCGAVAWQLSRGPISLDIVTDLVSTSLEAQFGQGFDVEVQHTDLRNTPEGLVLGIDGVNIRDAAGNLVVSSPQASVGLDIKSLITGQFQAREFQFIGLAIAVTILPNGQLSIAAVPPDQATPPAPTPPPPAPPTSGTQQTDTSVAQQMLGLGALADAVAGRTGPLAILDRAAIRQGKLTLTDMRRSRSITYSDLAVNFTRPQEDHETRLAVSARGPHGTWSVTAAVIGVQGHNKRLRFATRDLAVSEFLGFADPGLIPVHTDMPISLELTADFAADNAVMAIDGQITGGRALIEFQDKTIKPLKIDELKGAFSWDRERHLVALRHLDVAGGGSHLRMTGTVTPPSDTQAPWHFRLSSNDSALREESARNHQIEIDNIVIGVRIAQGFGGISIDEMNVTGPEVAITMAAVVGKFERQDGFSMNLNAKRMPAVALLSFWPPFIVPSIRAYFLDSVKGGRVDRFAYRINFTREQFADAMANRPVPDDAALLEIDSTDVAMIPQPGLPLFKSLDARSRLTGRTIDVVVTKGQIPLSNNRVVTLGETTFKVADINKVPPFATMTTKLRGGVDAFAELFQSEFLKPFYTPPFEPSQVKGQMESQVALGFPLIDNPRIEDVTVTATGTMSGLTIDRVIGRDKLENGQFTFNADKNGLLVKGDARIGGMASTLELKHPKGIEFSDITLTGTIDEASRNRKGFKFGNQLTGAVGVKAHAKEFGGPKQTTNVEIDLTRAGINGVIPGWVKPVGKAGKATFRLSTGAGDTMIFEELVLDGGNGVSAKGDVTLGPDGQLNAAKLSSLKISPGDSMTLEAERKDNVLKLSIRASTIDLRPELKTSFAPAATGPGSPANADIDLDLRATAASGFNNETLTNLDLKLSQRDGAWRDLKLSGKLGKASVIGQNARNEQNQPVIAIETTDAGALLRYLDLYRRMIGGNMLLQFAGKSDDMKGSIIIRQFALRDDPALANVAASSKAAGRQTINDAAEVPFTKLRADFAFDSGRMHLKDATLSGPQVGGTVEGTLDFTKDRADLSGTFVPAYGINNAFNHIPIVGQLLGGKDEGLFAINFRVSGALSSPTVTVNPLSAVAPGFLRKFFGVWGSGDETPAPAQPKPAPR